MPFRMIFGNDLIPASMSLLGAYPTQEHYAITRQNSHDLCGLALAV
jgi:hypothetical protein